MSFLDEKQAIVSPIDLYLDWKGKESDWFFSYYDKETQENVKYKIGKCSIINIWFVVKGFNENLNTSIYSNKIWNWDENVIVKSKWDILAQGIWKEIRDQVSKFWGNIHKAITLLDVTNNKIIEIYLKGQAWWGIIDKDTKKQIWGWFTTVEKASLEKMNIVDKEFPLIEFSEAKLVKGKAFKYNVPEFKVIDKLLNKEEVETYISACNTFDEYKKALNSNKKDKPATEPVSESFATAEDWNDVFQEVDDGNIPF